MKWYYIIYNNNILHEYGTTGILNILLRPVWIENGDFCTLGVVDFNILALDLIDQVQPHVTLVKRKPNSFDEIRSRLVDKEYYIQEQKLDDDEKKHYINRLDMYVINKFDLEGLFTWIRTYFVVRGYPCNDFEETSFEDFAMDVDPTWNIYNMKNNVKKSEAQFGPEWNKSEHKNTPDMGWVDKLLETIIKN